MPKKSEPTDTDNPGGEILRCLTEQEWYELLDRLLMFTSNYYSSNIDGRDLIQEAISAILEGRRRSWDLERPPFNNLCFIIRSVADNQIRKDKKLDFMDSAPETSADSATSTTSSSSHSPADIYERRESDEIVRARLQKSLKDDDLALRVANHLINDDAEFKPEHIAQVMGEETKKIYNTRKRLRRKLRVMKKAPDKNL